MLRWMNWLPDVVAWLPARWQCYLGRHDREVVGNRLSIISGVQRYWVELRCRDCGHQWERGGVIPKRFPSLFRK